MMGAPIASSTIRARIFGPCLASLLVACGGPSDDGLEPLADRGAPLVGSGYTATQYPLVFCHGMLGFRRLLGMVDYWFGISSSLRRGGAEVYMTEVPPLSSSEQRGEALIAQIERIVAISGKPRVNLIGHSQGGIDIRYVAAVRPDLVASVTTVGSPHAGAELATFLLDHTTPNGFARATLVRFTNSIGSAITLFLGTPTEQDSLAAAVALSGAGMQAFNTKYGAALPETPCGEGAPEVNGVRFYSWSGTTVRTNFFDVFDAALSLTSSIYREPSDGLVGRCSAHLGEVIRDDFVMNHVDQVNLMFGLTAPFQVNPLSIYRTHANRLKNAGL